MNKKRTEGELASYAEVPPSELSAHRLGPSSAVLLIGLGGLAGAAFFLVASSDSLTTTYLLLVVGTICLVGVCEVIATSRRCRNCHTRLISHENGDGPRDLVVHYVEVCDNCRRFSRYSRCDQA